VDCYFTYEEYYTAEGFPWSDVFLTEIGETKTTQDVIDQLRKQLPTAKVFTDLDNSAVIHIVDTRLCFMTYALEAKEDVSLLTSPTNLLQILECRGLPIREVWGGSLDGTVFFDTETRLPMRLTRGSVRRLLTDHLPLSDYHRLLWHARTEDTKDGHLTFVSFRGKSRRRASAWAMESLRLDDFAAGETAFVNNSGKRGAVEAALRFTEQRSKEKNPVQLRWALLFLGEEGDAANIPVLLQHLESCYTRSLVVEESYPAVKALRLLGVPATKACLSELRKDQSPLRQRLLCEVLVGALGPGEARQALARAMLEPGEPQRTRLRAARDLVQDDPPPAREPADD
jgi:hypothetical protein